MSKITNKERLEIWEKWKEGKGSIELSKEYGINDSSIRYLVRLLEAHGPGVLNQGKYRKYSKELKEEAIKKVLVERESIESISVQYGIPSPGQLKAWIKSYKENGYVILEKKKGRQPMKKKDTKRFMELVERLGLERQIKQMPETLSGGEQQRAAIARALINRPKIIFADESTGNLDEENKENVMRLLAETVRENDVTLIMVTHESDHLKYADRSYYMRDGIIERNR